MHDGRLRKEHPKFADRCVIRRGYVIGSLLRLVGFRYRGASFDDLGVALEGRVARKVAFSEFTDAA